MPNGLTDTLKAAWNAAKSLFSSKPVGSATEPCPLASRPMSETEAQKLVAEFKGRTSEIPFDYPRDCCYSRAHEMCRVMQSRGIACGKLWNYAHNYPNSGLTVPTPGALTGDLTTWRYHVAPTAQVRGSDGVVRDMVIDPSMFDHPVTQEEWIKAQNDPGSTQLRTGPEPYFQPPDGPPDLDSDYSQTKSMLAEHATERDLLKARRDGR